MTTTWRSKLKDQEKRAGNLGIKVKYVADNRTRDYIGMNPEAAKDMGFPIPKDEMWIDSYLSDKEKYQVLKHEIDEYLDMKNRGMSYWKAHCRALDAEEA